MTVASHTNPASVDTSQDSCGSQNNDKKKDAVYIKYR
jgi:hypothetical protein